MSPSASQTEAPSPPSLKPPPFLKNTEALPARQSQEAKLAGEGSSPDGQTHPEVPQELQQAGAVVILHLRAGLCRLPPHASSLPLEGAALPAPLVRQESSSRLHESFRGRLAARGLAAWPCPGHRELPLRSGLGALLGVLWTWGFFH